MSTPPKHLLRRADIQASPALHVAHPLNPRSEIHMKRLSDQAGMKRMGVNIGRIPPGKESFLPHAHTLQEEWVYVLEGHGHALLGDEQHEIGPGDFLGFPTDGTVHHLVNTGEADLVILQGGERTDFDVGIFPTIGKRMLAHTAQGVAHFVPEEAIETLPFSAWLANSEAKGENDG